MGFFFHGHVVEDSFLVGYDAMSLGNQSLMCLRKVQPSSSRVSRSGKALGDEGSMLLQNSRN
jgi:hypothetical protein